MVSSTVLLTSILGAFALIAGALYALVAQQGSRIDAVGAHLGKRIDELGAHLGGRIDEQGAHLGSRIGRVESRLDRMDENITGIRAAVGGIDGRLSTLEARG